MYEAKQMMLEAQKLQQRAIYMKAKEKNRLKKEMEKNWKMKKLEHEENKKKQIIAQRQCELEILEAKKRQLEAGKRVQ